LARDIFGNIFEFQGFGWNFSGPQLDFRQVRGSFAKWRGVSARDLFFNRKYHGGPRQRGQEGMTVPWRCMGARAHRCSPAMVEDDEPDEAAPEGCSLEHERRRRCGATEAKNGGSLSSLRGRRRVPRSSGERGKELVRPGGSHSLL
jgi:hypothetical protein